MIPVIIILLGLVLVTAMDEADSAPATGDATKRATAVTRTRDPRPRSARRACLGGCDVG